MNMISPEERAVLAAKRAYTLAEAVATTLAFAVLIACLAPATAGVARDSKDSKCLNNLARIGRANLVYSAMDPSEPALPVHSLFYDQPRNNPTYIGAYEWGGKSGVGRPCFIPGPCGSEDGWMSGKYSTLAGFGPSTRPLNDILYPEGFEDHRYPEIDLVGVREDTQLNLDLYQCPSDTGYTAVHFPEFRDEKRTSFDHFGTSYAANTFMTSYVGGGPMRSNSPYLHRMSDLISPATTLAFQENNGRYAWAVARETCDFIQPGIFGTVHGWHGRDWMFNAAFVDGHVDTIYMRGYRNPTVFRDAFAQSQQRCIIVRGEGWQKDVLPVPQVDTGLNWGGGGDRTDFEHGIE